MRGLFTFVVALVSLAACAASVVYWGLSYTRTGGGWHATYGDGSLCLFYMDPDTAGPYATDAFEHAPDHTGWWVWQNIVAHGTPTADLRAAGFRWRTGSADRFLFEGGDGSRRFGYRLLQVPFWSLTLATAVLPLIVFARSKVRRRRRSKHACVECGYDLRGSPGACPECGTVPAALISSS